MTVPAPGEPTPRMTPPMGEIFPPISVGSANAKTSAERISISRQKTEDVLSSTRFILES